MNQAGDKVILMVEDSEEDFFATRRAFTKLGYENLNLKRTENAALAYDFLLSRGRYKENKKEGVFPSLILLDLNLPGIDGREFLVQLKRDDRLRKIPVVILTTSNNPKDIDYCFENGANSYQIKSVGFEKYLRSIKAMINYWIDTAVLPSGLTQR